MKDRFLGDSHDLAKQAFLGWLARWGTWAIHPMLTERPSSAFVIAYEHLLGARALSDEVLGKGTNRRSYFACCDAAINVFLDPDTGISTKKTPAHVTVDELVSIAGARPGHLTLVFDQCFDHRKDVGEALKDKLGVLKKAGLSSVAYRSQASLILLTKDAVVLPRVFETLKAQSRIPEHRFLTNL